MDGPPKRAVFFFSRQGLNLVGKFQALTNETSRLMVWDAVVTAGAGRRWTKVADNLGRLAHTHYV
jgi:hypothetical protein